MVSSTTSIFPEALRKIQTEVMRKMVVVAEDAEGVGGWLVKHPYFRKKQDPVDLRQYEGMLDSRLVPRLVLTLSAAVLHGWCPLDDPFFALLVLGYASGSLTKQLAGNLMILFEKTLLGQNVIKDDFLMESLPDIWRTSDTTEEIDQGLFRLFEALERRGGNMYSRMENDGFAQRRRQQQQGQSQLPAEGVSSPSLQVLQATCPVNSVTRRLNLSMMSGINDFTDNHC